MSLDEQEHALITLSRRYVMEGEDDNQRQQRLTNHITAVLYAAKQMGLPIRQIADEAVMTCCLEDARAA